MKVAELRALIAEATKAAPVTGGAPPRDLPWMWAKNYQLAGSTHWALNSPTDPHHVVSLGLVSNDCYRDAPDPEMRLVEAAVNALPAALDVIEAATKVLQGGRHEGPCPTTEGGCPVHLHTAHMREDRLAAALAKWALA